MVSYCIQAYYIHPCDDFIKFDMEDIIDEVINIINYRLHCLYAVYNYEFYKKEGGFFNNGYIPN